MTAVRLAILLIMACVLDLDAARGQRPYTVDDMLSVESIGKAVFDPSGRRLVFERHGPFDRQSDFGRPYLPGELRSKIYLADLDGTAPPSLPFAQQPGEGFTIDGLSPDGRWLLFRRASTDGLTSGLIRLGRGKPRMFAFSPVYNPGQTPPWIGHRFVVAAGRPGEVDLYAAIERERVEAVAALWRQRNRGRTATASRIGSGRFESFAPAAGALLLADAGTARLRTLAAGRYSAWHASADGSALAALREERLSIDPERRIEHGANMGGIERRLVILNPVPVGKAPPSLDPCPGCDVLASSLNWSATAPLLSFVARDEGGDWAAARYRVYDHRTGQTRAVDLGSLRPHIGRAGGEIDIRSAWIGDRLAVLAEASADGRADWYLAGPGPWRNLTDGFEGAAPALIGLGRESLVILHGGDAWRIDAAGNRSNLTAGISEPVRAWRQPEPYAHLPPDNLQPSESITLQIAPEGAERPARLLFVNPDSGRIDTVVAPAPDSKFVAASAAGRLAAVTGRSGNATTLTAVWADGSHRELVRLNGHLNDAVGGTPVRIDHKGPAGDDRMSWILLPPNHRPGQRVPTVVNVYPGSVGGASWSKWALDDVHALNDHILAARGYAVLYPSLPVRYEQVPRDPLEGLVEEVFAAVDAAIALGWVDPDRMAVQGQSYGGYTTGALVGLTKRFRSAIAQDGFYDLISHYGQFDIRRRLDMERTGLDLFAVSSLETDQGGMGAPPWKDPERYLRNSPLMYVQSVSTPIMLMAGDLDYVSTTQSEEFFTALTRLNKDAVFVRYYGEGHVPNSPANIRDMWRRIFEWYATTLAPTETGEWRRGRDSNPRYP